MPKLGITAALITLGSLVAACAEPPHAVPPKAPNNELVIGEFERHPPDGTTAIRFRGDGSVRVAKTKAELDTDPPLASGTWKVEAGKLTLTYDTGACTESEADKAGVYDVVISRVGIHFKKVEDSCARRAGLDGQTLWRIK
jgi:hypothetical protein